MSNSRLILLRHAATTASRRRAFPDDEPLDDAGALTVARERVALPALDSVFCSPARRARQTAAALALQPHIDPALIECDFGSWRGRELADLYATDREAAEVWMTDPAAAPHGGESMLELIDRVSAWLRLPSSREGRVLAITHGGVIRAAITIALGAPPSALWRIHLDPLDCLILDTSESGLRLRGLGPLRLAVDDGARGCRPVSVAGDQTAPWPLLANA